MWLTYADGAGGRKARPYDIWVVTQAVAKTGGVGAGFIPARMKT